MSQNPHTAIQHIFTSPHNKDGLPWIGKSTGITKLFYPGLVSPQGLLSLSDINTLRLTNLFELSNPAVLMERAISMLPHDKLIATCSVSIRK